MGEGDGARDSPNSWSSSRSAAAGALASTYHMALLVATDSTVDATKRTYCPGDRLVSRYTPRSSVIALSEPMSTRRPPTRVTREYVTSMPTTGSPT
jgi:hypothetical protein